MLEILLARAALYKRVTPSRSYLNFVRRTGIDVNVTVGFAGMLAVTPIVTFGNDCFDFAEANDPAGIEAAVIEALGRDGESTLDLLAWPTDDPRRVFTMYRRAAFVGLWQAWNPFSYALGLPLTLHRTPEDWLRAGCEGAAVVVPQLAARDLLDLPGRFAPRDREHAYEMKQLMVGLTRNRMMLLHTKRAVV